MRHYMSQPMTNLWESAQENKASDKNQGLILFQNINVLTAATPV